MAHLLEEEGQSTQSKQADEIAAPDNIDSATSKWLIENKLGHLQKVFASENITIEELQSYNAKELEAFLNEFVNDEKVAFNNRDKMRITKKLKSSNPNKTSQHSQQPQQPQVQYQQIMITEAEQTAMKSLTEKFEELQQEQKSVEGAIDDLKDEHTKQQKMIHGVFNEIMSGVEQRKNSLLKKMKTMVDGYNDELNEALTQIANNRNVLTNTQNRYEENMRNSARSGSS